ncbi:alpha/beta hydrolase [Tsukamurella pseudospumae]|uniref:Peptidase S15 n=1 Tax=Tsukamurella pseudospumae TaxID=239498 RepID=A0A137YUC9_9ACTN|nr:alpha/beta fold hydrolase [Tsukamurella pseudospumae]KXO89528.1 peptidase S15 [Tsukamurella pseudospumae]
MSAPAPSTTTEVSFTSHGVRCAAWHVRSASEALARDGRRPVVVLAHGFGGTRDTGLLVFARAFADAGIDALVFDYRTFGDSDGEPRQQVSYRMQREDYRAAVDAARRLPGVDPERIALWGTSYSGGHVIDVAAGDPRIAAVVGLVPATDGAAALLQVARYAGPILPLRLVGHGLWDVATAVAGRAPHRIPLAARPGDPGIITTSGSYEAYTAMGGPTWRNEVCARTALEIGLNRPTTKAGRVTCPVLFQVGTRDRVAPAAAARRTAARIAGPAEVAEYPIDHFDGYDGPWRDVAIADEVAFLTRVLLPTSVAPRPTGRRSRHGESSTA